MNFSRAVLAAVFIAGLAGLAALPVRAVPYTVQELGQLNGGEDGYDKTWATGINASGQVVGYAYKSGIYGESSTNEYRAFATGANGMGMRSLGTLGGSWSRAFGINDTGQVVGSAGTADGSAHAFLGDPPGSALVDLGTLGGTSSAARAINRHGQIAGTASNALGQDRAFITGPGGANMRDLGALGGVQSQATGIDDLGRVIGIAQVHPDNGTSPFSFGRAFISKANGGTLSEIPVRGQDPSNTARWSHASAINSRGDVTGVFENYRGGNARPFYVRSGDTIATPLDVSALQHVLPPSPTFHFSVHPLAMNSLGQIGGEYVNGPAVGAFITDADGSNPRSINELEFTNPEDLPNRAMDSFYSVAGINDAGQILVNTINSRSYLLTPVPEPTTALLLVGGLGWLTAMGRRRSIDARRPHIKTRRASSPG